MSNDLVGIELEQPEYRDMLNDLQALSSDLQDKAIKSALKYAGKPLLQAMKTAAPDDPSTAGSRLERALNITQAKTGTRVRTGAGNRFVDLKSGEFGVVVGPNKKVQDGKAGKRNVDYIAWMIESGTRAHAISSKNNILKLGPRFLRKPVHHPGITPKRWMAGAFVAASSQVEQQFYIGLEKWLDKNGRISDSS